MDQDKTNGPEKRNWREKLGIGTNGTAKDLPKISNDFTKAAPAGAAVVTAPRPVAPRGDAPSKSAVKTAPMAPRPGSAAMAKSAAPRPAAPVSPDKLAERLRSQRDASAKLAEQRVQVARQRADTSAPAATAAPAPSASAGPKPKFAFAEDDSKAARQVPQAEAEKLVAAVQRPAPLQAAPPAAQPAQRPAAFQPQPKAQPALAPSRPSLGAAPQPFPPRPPQQAPQQATPGQGFPQQVPPGYPPQGFGQQPPGYRPIDPATGYPQQPYAPYGQQPFPQQGRPPFVPNQRFNQPPQNYAPPAGPRLNVPQRPGLNANLSGAEPTAFNTPQPGVRQPPRVAREPDGYDDMSSDDSLFETPASSLQRPTGRRPSSSDYQQAYRDAEAGFEEELPSSKLPWILPGILLVGVLLAGLLTWGYLTKIKPMMNGTQQATTTQTEVPVVQPPTQPARAQPETTQQTNAAGGATRKQIYDRIVGDKEVLGGQMVPTEEVPASTEGANAAPQPDGTGDAVPAQGGDAVPLPIPPPPGDNTQGALPSQPEDPNKQSAETTLPAAGESQAAVAVPAPGEASAESSALAQNTVKDSPSAAANSVAAIPAADDPQAAAPEEQIVPEKPKTVAPKKKAAASINKLKQLPKRRMADLGAKPVVLVPAPKKAKSAAQTDQVDAAVTTAEADANTADNGLYGTKYIVDSPAANVPAANAGTAVAPKKKKTLADLFRSDSGDAATQTASNSVPEAATPKATAPVVAAKPAAPVQQASAASNGFVAQLASFRSNAEATAEFSRMKSKYGSALSGLSPVIRQAEVAGTTRYRLAVGPFASRDEANALCSKLFAAGERDCLVRN
jgi:SPOR domain